MKSYLIKLPDGTQMGPFPWEKIDKLYASRRISGDDLVWTEGMPAWLPLREVQKKKDENYYNISNPSNDFLYLMNPFSFIFKNFLCIYSF